MCRYVYTYIHYAITGTMVPCKCFMKCQPNDFQMWCYPWFTRLRAGERDLPACWLCAVRRRSSVWLTPRVFTDVNRNGLNYYTLPHSWVEAQYDQTVLYSIVEPCPYSSRFFTCVATVWNHRRDTIEPQLPLSDNRTPRSLCLGWIVTRATGATRGSAKQLAVVTPSWPPGQVTTWGRHLRTAKATWSHLQLGK